LEQREQAKEIIEIIRKENAGKLFGMKIDSDDKNKKIAVDHVYKESYSYVLPVKIKFVNKSKLDFFVPNLIDWYAQTGNRMFVYEYILLNIEGKEVLSSCCMTPAEGIPRKLLDDDLVKIPATQKKPIEKEVSDNFCVNLSFGRERPKRGKYQLYMKYKFKNNEEIDIDEISKIKNRANLEKAMGISLVSNKISFSIGDIKEYKGIQQQENKSDE